MSELVSIITPCFNSERYLDECILSVINQTYQNWEMLIVDDKSTDKSKDLINLYSQKEKRIITFLLEKNVGPAEARNYAISKANGRYIAFLDSDDIWMPNKLKEQLDFMRCNNYSFVFSSYQVISENNKILINSIKVPKKINYNQYLKNTIIGCLTVVIDTKKYKNIKMPNFRSSQDMATWLNLLRNGDFAYGLNKNLAQYRVVSNSNTKNKIKAAYDVWKVYRNHEKLNVLDSLYYFVYYAKNAFIKRLF